MMTNFFMTLQQFSVEFITQLVTVASLNCSQTSLSAELQMIKNIAKFEDFRS